MRRERRRRRDGTFRSALGHASWLKADGTKPEAKQENKETGHEYGQEGDDDGDGRGGGAGVRVDSARGDRRPRGRQGGHREDARLRSAVLPAVPRGGAARRLGRDEDPAAEPAHGAAGPDQGADRPGRRGAGPLPLLHRRAHRVRQAQRRERGRDRRGGRDGGHHPPLEHVPERHPDRRDEVPGEIAKIIENVKKASASKAPAAPPVNVVDGASALKEVTQILGATRPNSSASSRTGPRGRLAPDPRRAAEPVDRAARARTRS